MKHHFYRCFCVTVLAITAICAFSGNTLAAPTANNIQRAAYPSIALTYPNAAAILPDGTLWAWGSGANGTLGNGRTASANKPIYVDSDVVCATICNQTGAFPGDELEVSLFYVKEDNTLWACGNNSSGILADGTKKNRLKPIKIMEGIENIFSVCFPGGLIYAQKTDGSLVGWGRS